MTKKLIIELWKKYADVLLDTEEILETASDGSVGDYLYRESAFVQRIEARAAYVKALLDAGILSPYEGVPSDDLLCESHPNNLRAELDAS
jgi:hypothetical protein